MEHPTAQANTAGVPNYDRIVVIASSAGGLHALTTVLEALPACFPAPIIIVQHLDPHHRSHLADILARRTKLAVREAEEGDRLCAGVVYIAPPDRHVLAHRDATLSLSQSALVHFLRPSADPLFEPAAVSYPHRAIGLVLTGRGVDGSMGIQAIKKTGGVVIVQDPLSSEFPGMPTTAIQTRHVDYVVPLDQIGSRLVIRIRQGEARGAEA